MDYRRDFWQWKEDGKYTSVYEFRGGDDGELRIDPNNNYDEDLFNYHSREVLKAAMHIRYFPQMMIFFYKYASNLYFEELKKARTHVQDILDKIQRVRKSEGLDPVTGKIDSTKIFKGDWDALTEHEQYVYDVELWTPWEKKRKFLWDYFGNILNDDDMRMTRNLFQTFTAHANRVMHCLPLKKMSKNLSFQLEYEDYDEYEEADAGGGGEVAEVVESHQLLKQGLPPSVPKPLTRLYFKNGQKGWVTNYTTAQVYFFDCEFTMGQGGVNNNKMLLGSVAIVDFNLKPVLQFKVFREEGTYGSNFMGRRAGGHAAGTLSDGTDKDIVYDAVKNFFQQDILIVGHDMKNDILSFEGKLSDYAYYTEMGKIWDSSESHWWWRGKTGGKHGYKLKEVYKNLFPHKDIQVGTHTALEDARAVGEIFHKYLEFSKEFDFKNRFTTDPPVIERIIDPQTEYYKQMNKKKKQAKAKAQGITRPPVYNPDDWDY